MVLSSLTITLFLTVLLHSECLLLLASIMGYAANGFRFCECWLGGQLADKKGLSNMLVADIVLMMIGVFGLLFTPRSMSFMWMLILSIALLCSFMYSAQALHYAVLEKEITQ